MLKKEVLNSIKGLLKKNKELKMGYMGCRETVIDSITLDELNSALEWSLKLSGPVIIRACTNSEEDTLLRKNITDGLKKYIN